MNRFALLSLYRSLTRHRLYAVLNIGGLALGIAVFLVLSLYVRSELGFEKWLPNHNKVYILEDVWNVPGTLVGPSQDSMPGTLELLKQDFPGLVGTRIKTPPATVLRDGVGTDEGIALVDPEFFQLFALPSISGNPSAALLDPANIILEQHIADKYFPNGDALGNVMTVNVNGKPGLYRVAAVIADLPAQTHLKLGMIARLVPPKDDPLWYHWGSESLRTYLHFATPKQAQEFEDQLDAFVRRHAGDAFGSDPLDTLHMALLPLDSLHLVDPSSKVTVTTLGLVGLVTLFIALVNYINLAVARSDLRAREVAMRKVLGASRGALIRQFLSEAMIVVALAALLGLVLAELGLPLVNAAGGLSLTIPYRLVVPGLIALTVCVGFVAGAYPAMILSRFSIVGVLASSRAPGGGRAGARLREALVVMQFGLSTAFIIGTLVLVAQTAHVRNASLGYDRSALVVVPSFKAPELGESQLAELLDAFRRAPDVVTATYADAAPGDDSTINSNSIELPGRPGFGPSLQNVVVGPDFFKTIGARILAGRGFDTRHRNDDIKNRDNSDDQNIVISQQAVPVLGFASPADAIGKHVGKGAPRTIIGVVSDLRFYSPRRPMQPTYYTYRSSLRSQASDPIAIVRTTNSVATLDGIRAAWMRIAPDVPFEARTAAQNVARYYEDDDHISRLFIIGAVLAVLIGCIGLWGLASFNAARRVKEIGIRKALGASSSDIFALMAGQLLRPVVVANIIAWPLALFAMRSWLAGFDDRVALSPIFFIVASAVAVLIALITVFGHALRASRATTAWALHHE
ncbi:ABC transporter permease [Stakelama marina]|uniref:ABC transporter permease n=1 Tax=Stakelama marina TaxID=2826939 RepID=A0A8T4IG35_9SPHN|nr:ABC transporter permease [Stakelama marina]MBR0551196.1 ABC transporter permease [Stakelama marina]